MIEPVYEQLEGSEAVNMLFVTDPDFTGLDMGALCEDAKAAGSVGLKHRFLGRFRAASRGGWRWES